MKFVQNVWKIITLGVLVILCSFLFCSCAKSIENVSLNKDYISIEHGQSFSLTATVLPEEAENKDIEWIISDPNVISIVSSNLLTKEFKADNVGETKIIARSHNGKTFTCNVVVNENAEDIAERERRAEEERIEKERKEEEERIKKEQQEQEEKKGYDTGITFQQLSRNPEEYKYKKVKFTGKVVQVLEGSNEINLRINVTQGIYGMWDDTILVYYNPSIVSSRVLEDDIITIYGMSMGLHTYKSTTGQSITIPLISVSKIEQ